MPKADLRHGTMTLAPFSVFPLPARYRRADDKRCARRKPGTRWALLGKRAVDALGSAALITLLSPMFLLLIVLIPLDSPGSPFFVHERIGLHGRTFWVYKFRTMSRGAHKHRQHWAGEKPERLLFKHRNDPRVTSFGRFLRKYSLDELPQLINVLRGEMSLIGPRPLLKEDFDGHGAGAHLLHRWIRDRHLLWPGITGLWQVSGRSELSLEESMRVDLRYINEWSLRLDMRILWMTVPAVLAGKGAY